MHVIFLGLRGIPGIQGGIESHVKHLSPLLAKLGCEVEVLIRSPFYDKDSYARSWNGVKLTRLWSPRTNVLETAIHTFVGVLYASLKRPEILHIHGIGPALMTPLARLLGLNVIVTHHTADYEREKWGTLTRKIFLLGEWAGMRFANERIVVSEVIRDTVKHKYHKESFHIPNGVDINEQAKTKTCPTELSLIEKKYILNVGRFDPGKRNKDLLQAFELAKLNDWKLVFVGDKNQDDEYTKEFVKSVNDKNNVVLAGFRSGLALQELYSHAGVFILSSSHEGLPIALLEALSYGLPVLASDIPANREISLPSDQYFQVGDINTLAEKIQSITHKQRDETSSLQTIKNIQEKYDWDKISQQTYSVYLNLVQK